MHIIFITIILRIVGRLSGYVYSIIPGLLIYESPLVQMTGDDSEQSTVLCNESVTYVLQFYSGCLHSRSAHHPLQKYESLQI